MDILRVKGMKFHAFHGHNPQEKIDGNDFEIDLALHLNMTQPGRSDELDDAVDYAELRRMVSEIMNGPSVDLIEHLAYMIGTKIWETHHDRIQSLTVSLRKLNPPIEGQTDHVEAQYSWPR